MLGCGDLVLGPAAGEQPQAPHRGLHQHRPGHQPQHRQGEGGISLLRCSMVQWL